MDNDLADSDLVGPKKNAPTTTDPTTTDPITTDPLGDAWPAEVSAEFSILADRLRKDAHALSSRYPARNGTTILGLVRDAGNSSSSPAEFKIPKWVKNQMDCPGAARRALAFRFAAAMALIGAGFWLVHAIGAVPANAPIRRSELVEHARVERRQVGDSAAKLWALKGEVQPVSHETLIMPARSFRDLSGPEQEAVLDLMEEKVLAQADLSI